MTRGPFTYSIDWKAGDPVHVVVEVPIGAVARHVRVFPAEPAIVLARHVANGNDHIIKIVYDCPDTKALKGKRLVFAVDQNHAFQEVGLVECIGGFIHPVDGLGWLLYEAIGDPSASPMPS